MTSYSGPSGGSPLSMATPYPSQALGPHQSVQASYGYGPLGQLITETATTMAPGGPLGQGGSSRRTRTISWDTTAFVPEAIKVDSFSYIYANGLPLEQLSKGGVVLYYLHDRQGSTIGLVDQNGRLVASYGYSPYGSLVCMQVSPAGGIGPSCMDTPGPGPGTPTRALPAPPQSCTGTTSPMPPGPDPSPGCLAKAISANPFFYDGQYLDHTSGLYYLRARWYDPQTGQFTSLDPLVAVTNEPYGYAGDDPVNNSDPTGDATLGLCGALGGSALGPAGFAEGCLVRNLSQSNDQIGFTGTLGGGGASSLAAFANGYIQVTNATNLNDLRGPFAWFEVDVAEPVDGSVVVFTGTGTHNQTIYGIEIGGGVAAEASVAAGAPFTIAAGAETTGVHILTQWWIADALRAFWDFAVGPYGAVEVAEQALSKAESILHDLVSSPTVASAC